MNRRTCTCGAVIVCADLDGYDVWLDQHPRGWINLDAHGHAAVGAGAWRRHSCEHDPKPLDLGGPLNPQRHLTLLRNLDRANARRAHVTIRRTDIAIQVVLAAHTTLSPLERQIAELRSQHPTADCRELAALTGLRANTCRNALARIRVYANQIFLTAQSADQGEAA